MVTDEHVRAFKRVWNDTYPTHEAQIRAAIQAVNDAAWLPIDRVPRKMRILYYKIMGEEPTYIFWSNELGKTTMFRPLPTPPKETTT